MCEDAMDRIFEMMDWNQPEGIQKEGMEIAGQIKDLRVFMQPVEAKHNKNVWENCAKVLALKTDEELKPYMYFLLERLQDLTWPGALIVATRLKSYRNQAELDREIRESAQLAVDSGDGWGEVWLENLSQIFSKDLSNFMRALSQNSEEGKALEMMDCSQPKVVQERGTELAARLNIIHFLMPDGTLHNKNMWENCAKVVSQKSDEELKPFLFSLLQDARWPGALIVAERLKNYKDDESLRTAVEQCEKRA